MLCTYGIGRRLMDTLLFIDHDIEDRPLSKGDLKLQHPQGTVRRNGTPERRVLSRQMHLHYRRNRLPGPRADGEALV